MNDYSRIDNGLANSQLDIGESSNLAQIAQTYTCNFDDHKYIDYVCILSVLAQVAIDSAKRRFDIDLSEEIKRIKKDMDIKTHKYPSFWKVIKRDFNKDYINENLICPMNYLCELNLSEFHSQDTTLPMNYFFQKYEVDNNIRTCRKVEDLIEKYSIKLYGCNSNDTYDSEKYFLLRNDYDDLISDIQKIKISKNYIGLFSWLIDRGFIITPNIKSTQWQLKSTINKNRSILLKVLYTINPQICLNVFQKTVKNVRFLYIAN